MIQINKTRHLFLNVLSLDMSTLDFSIKRCSHVAHNILSHMQPCSIEHEQSAKIYGQMILKNTIMNLKFVPFVKYIYIALIIYIYYAKPWPDSLL